MKKTIEIYDVAREVIEGLDCDGENGVRGRPPLYLGTICGVVEGTREVRPSEPYSWLYCGWMGFEFAGRFYGIGADSSQAVGDFLRLPKGAEQNLRSSFPPLGEGFGVVMNFFGTASARGPRVFVATVRYALLPRGATKEEMFDFDSRLVEETGRQHDRHGCVCFPAA